MIRSYYTGRSQNVDDLRSASKAALSLPDFRNVLWIGVFGSFARDQQGDRSDVDIVVVERSDHGLGSSEESGNSANQEPWTLEDLLPRVWCRPVQIIRIQNQELRGLVSVDALLTARTIYGNDECQEILKLRQDARSYLEQGWSIFKTAETEIEAMKSRVGSIGGFEEFSGSPTSQQSLRDDLLHILQSFDIKPTWHPMYEGFWSAVIQPADELKRIITSSQESPNYWKDIWEVLSGSSPKTLQSVLMRLKKFVFPILTDIEERVRLSERLEHDAKLEEPAVAAVAAVAVAGALADNQISAVVQSGGINEAQRESNKAPITGAAKARGFKRHWKRFKARLGL